jgi:hypothetical protein
MDKNNKFSIVEILPNKYNLNFPNNNYIYPDSFNDYSDYLCFHDISLTDDIAKQFVDIINMKNDDIGDTIICYKEEEYIYELFFVDKVSGNTNNICTKLANGKHIFDTAILLKSKKNNEKYENVSITKYDVFILIKNILIHEGIIIDNYNKITIFNYFNNPLEWMANSDEYGNFRHYEIDMKNFILIIIIELKPSFNDINILASLINNTNVIKGKVILALRKVSNDMYDIDDNFININNNVFNQILINMYNKNIINNNYNNELVNNIINNLKNNETMNEKILLLMQKQK